jgi:hypothetical protein
MKSAGERKTGGSEPRSHVQEVFIEDDQYRVILQAVPGMLKPMFVVAYHLPLRKMSCLVFAVIRSICSKSVCS